MYCIIVKLTSTIISRAIYDAENVKLADYIVVCTILWQSYTT